MNKIPVGVLGATGAVGQRFVQLLAGHPWFEVTALAASERSAGKRYADVCKWVIPGDPPPAVGEIVVQPLEPSLPARLVFSALPADVAREIEPQFARAGYVVCTNASPYRAVDDVPLLIPEVNADHVALIDTQRAERNWRGLIVASPNCTITGVALPLKPLDVAFGVRKVFMTSMQAISGAGYPGVASLDILDNVVPYIPGEEEKFAQELRKMLGSVVDGRGVDADIVLSAHANRVPVFDGHTVSLSVGFEHPASVEDVIAALRDFRGTEVSRGLPSAPEHPLLVRMEPDRPQPRRDRDAGGGMAVTVGRVRPCPLLDIRMTTVSHNTLRGAASGAILNAELLVATGYVA
ncbi:MAG TPA: aspartate-semialdehyde dehydrogenase [Anaerolineae bacterium]|nr:aspartate-semialdehyde dehydrogenase [Anaerolineae bacterium]HQI85722.1 aspartate-semialdehyde dehydrogenase [Anaerolineae bacterium]